MDERERRIGENEALFRSVNERVRELNEAFATLTETMSIVCECGQAACMERLDVPGDTYAAVRADPHRFLVVPGHEIPDVETVVERGERWFVLEKREGGPSELAEETDPAA